MRILKKEVMSSQEEAMAYDLVVSKYTDIVHAGFAETVINLSPSDGKFLEVGTGKGSLFRGSLESPSPRGTPSGWQKCTFIRPDSTRSGERRLTRSIEALVPLQNVVPTGAQR